MAPPLVEIHPTSPVAAYRQIADSLRRHLVEGALKPGDLLPPIRQLALDLGVHFNTVAQAYRALADEGWLDLKRRRGAMVVRRDEPAIPDKQRISHILKHLSNLTAELRMAGLTQGQIAVALRRLSKGHQP